MCLPITPLKGLILPGLHSFDGPWFVPGLRKDRVKRLWSTPSSWYDNKVLQHCTFSIGLNCISRKYRPFSKRYRPWVIDLLAQSFRGEVRWYKADVPELIKKFPLVQDNWQISPGADNMTMILFRSNLDHGCVGNPEDALFYLKKGIEPELASDDHDQCSIGWCEKESKWYGWSHRAMHGFAIGDVVKEGDCVAISGWTDDFLAEHPDKDHRLPVGFKAMSRSDCKMMAIAFADSVG